MSTDLALLLLCSAAGVMAIALIVAPSDDRRSTVRPVDRELARRAVPALLVGVVVLAVSGWLVPAAIVGIATWFIVRRWQQRDRRRLDDVERTDALASWIENLRDVLLAGDQPVGAIAATVPTCPPSIRPAVRRLSTSLSRQDPELAFRRFADDIDDPLGDLIAAGLLVAVRRGARTVAVLSALAEQARTQADRRRVLDAERAPIQREVTLLSVIMGSLILGLLVFGRVEYLEPYDTPGGQLFLGVVLAIYAALLLRVQRLARYPRPSRFLLGAPPDGGRRIGAAEHVTAGGAA